MKNSYYLYVFMNFSYKSSVQAIDVAWIVGENANNGGVC